MRAASLAVVSLLIVSSAAAQAPCAADAELLCGDGPGAERPCEGPPRSARVTGRATPLRVRLRATAPTHAYLIVLTQGGSLSVHHAPLEPGEQRLPAQHGVIVADGGAPRLRLLLTTRPDPALDVMADSLAAPRARDVERALERAAARPGACLRVLLR